MVFTMQKKTTVATTLRIVGQNGMCKKAPLQDVHQNCSTEIVVLEKLSFPVCKNDFSY